jgi:hypothetical protein
MSTQILQVNQLNNLHYYDISVYAISGSYYTFKFTDEILNSEKLVHLHDTSTYSNYNNFEIQLTTGSEDLYNGIVNLNTGWHRVVIYDTLSGSINESDAYTSVLNDRVYVSGSSVIQNYFAADTATVIDGMVTHSLHPGEQYACVCAPQSVHIQDYTSSFDVPGYTSYTCSIQIAKIYNSNSQLLHSALPGSSTIIGDSLIISTSGSYSANVLAEGSLILPDTNIKNSDNSFSQNYESCVSESLTDITVTNPITGATYPYPAKKDLTESLSKQGKFTFPATYDDAQDYDITAVEAATYATETLTNVATVVYKVNTVVKTLPFTVVNTDTLNITITRTNAALKSTVIIKT